MSSPNPPITDLARNQAAPLGIGLAAELARTEGPHEIDISRSSAPEEVLEQMAHADAINERLRGRGLQIGFALSADGRCLQIELRDSSGTLLRTLSAAEAVGLADGRPLE